MNRGPQTNSPSGTGANKDDAASSLFGVLILFGAPACVALLILSLRSDKVRDVEAYNNFNWFCAMSMFILLLMRSIGDLADFLSRSMGTFLVWSAVCTVLRFVFF